MKSKISYFNKTIFKKNLTLYWPLWTAFLLYMLAGVPVSLYQYMREYSVTPETKQFIALRSVFNFATEPVVLFIFCVAAVMAVFSYLYTAKNANGIHGLPVTRLELFVTNSVSAFFFLALAELIAFIAGVFVGILCGVTRIDILFYAFLMQLGITLFGVAFSTCIAMLTGHILIFPAYCLIANYLYVIVRYVVENLIIELTYGLTELWVNDKSYVLSPLYYMSQTITASLGHDAVDKTVRNVTIQGGTVVAGYAVAGVALLVLAYRLYSKRQLETAGDIIAVKFMKPVFRFGVGIFGGTTLGLILAELFYFETVQYSNGRFFIKLFFVMASNLIGFFAAEMLMQKNFRIFNKKILVQAGVSVATAIIFMGCIHGDVFGLERKLPKKDEIVKAFANFDYPVKYEGEEIENLLAIHQQILDEKDITLALQTKDNAANSVTFRYLLKDGRVFSRSYNVLIGEGYYDNQETVGGKLIEKELETERLTKYVLGVNYENNKYLTGSIYLYDKYQNHFEYRLSEDELTAIVNALKKDIADGNYANYLLYSLRRNDLNKDEFVNDVNFTYYSEEPIIHIEDEYWELQDMYYQYYEEMGSAVMNGAVAETVEVQTISFGAKFDTDNYYMSFGRGCTNLINVLEELGIVNDTWHLYTHEEYETLRTDEK